MTFRPKEGADLKISLSVAFADSDDKPNDEPGDESGDEPTESEKAVAHFIIGRHIDALYAKVWDRIRAAGAMYMTPETIVRTSIETVLDETERALKEKLKEEPNAV
jgi:hypothetical protein